VQVIWKHHTHQNEDLEYSWRLKEMVECLSFVFWLIDIVWQRVTTGQISHVLNTITVGSLLSWRLMHLKEMYTRSTVRDWKTTVLSLKHGVLQLLRGRQGQLNS